MSTKFTNQTEEKINILGGVVNLAGEVIPAKNPLKLSGKMVNNYEDKPKGYTIALNREELIHLGWMANRGYFPASVFSGMNPATPEEHEKSDLMHDKLIKDGEITWLIPEHLAWDILIQREQDSDSLYSCAGGELLEKLLKLESEIV
jgi:hypothetical protein